MGRLTQRVARTCRSTRDMVAFAGVLVVTGAAALALGVASLRRLDTVSADRRPSW